LNRYKKRGIRAGACPHELGDVMLQAGTPKLADIGSILQPAF
jgi:hypothetical protein